jgi:hypothetical protein
MYLQTLLPLLAFVRMSQTAPTQSILSGGDQGEFPIPQPLPFNATIPGVNYELIAKLRASPDQITRIALLEDSDFKFDFRNPPPLPAGVVQGKGGKIVLADVKSMPALADTGSSLAVAFMEAW